MMKKFLVLGFVAIVSLPLAARADLLTGELNFTGSATISFGSIAFDDGNVFNINPADTQEGTFASLGSTDGLIDNIANPPDATGPLDVPDFITFAAAPNLSITLTYLLPGIDGAAGCADSPPAAGQQCTPDTPAQSPFNLENTSATSSTASFNILGIEVDSLTGDTIPITGAFTTPFTSMNFQQLLAEVLTPGGSITTSFSGEIATVATVVAPEPSALIELLTGIFALGICLGYRRKSARI
jgi:hypothetical protein